MRLRWRKLWAIYRKTGCETTHCFKLHRMYAKFIIHKLFCDCVLWGTCIGSWGFLWKFTAVIYTFFSIPAFTWKSVKLYIWYTVYIYQEKLGMLCVFIHSQSGHMTDLCPSLYCLWASVESGIPIQYQHHTEEPTGFSQVILHQMKSKGCRVFVPSHFVPKSCDI